VVPAQLVAEPLYGVLLVDRLAGEDRADGVSAQLRSAACHSLALAAVVLHEDVGDPVHVGEHERRALLLRREEVLEAVDAVVQRLRPAIPEPRVPEAIGAQQHRQRDPAAYEAADVLRRLDRHDERVGIRAGAQQSQHLVDVRLAAGEHLFAQLLVLVGRQLGQRGREMVHEGLRDLSRRRQQVSGELSHRTRGGVLGEGVALG
jgi:hypothetical protein